MLEISLCSLVFRAQHLLSIYETDALSQFSPCDGQTNTYKNNSGTSVFEMNNKLTMRSREMLARCMLALGLLFLIPIEYVAAVETISVSRLPLPPTAPSSATGSCSSLVNPQGTGCLDASRSGIDGARNFSIDGQHVFVSVRFAGAPAAPDPASIYSGAQLIMVKTDGSTFPNGDGWKCITCGVPSANKVGINDPSNNTYPEAFADGMRVKFGLNILDCSPHQVTDASCTPANTHIYPIISPFPAGLAGGIMRELRLHPDNVHLGWNQLFFSSDFLAATQFGVLGRLQFNPSPTSGAPGYELSDVTFMLSPELGKSGRFFSVNGAGELVFNRPMGVIGEFRGFTSNGLGTLGIGTQDSFNMDIFSTSLSTGRSNRLTRDPAYTDPVNMSPDGESMIVLDGRVTAETGYPDANPAGTDGRMYFAGAGIGVPPLIDLAIAEAVAGLYTNSARGSFFQPYLYSVRDAAIENRLPNANIHDGQPLNVGEDPTAGSGSISDPLWLAGADPAWSPDGTAVVYYQRRGCNSGSSCPSSTEQGGRQSRLMIARLTDRQPTTPLAVEPLVDGVRWGTPYTAGDTLPPVRQTVPAGTYTLNGVSGSAVVVITEGPSRFNAGAVEVTSVTVTYNNYSADGLNFINGTESGTRTTNTSSTTHTWHAALTFSGQHSGSRTTSEPGGYVVTMGSLGSAATSTGTLTTVLDGMTFVSPSL